jgi:hypothetical protein
MLPPQYSFETHGPSYGTEESRAAGQAGRNNTRSQRTLRRPAPVYAIASSGVFWRCDLDGYGAYDYVKGLWKSKRRLGRAEFERIDLAPPDKIGTRDVPVGQRPHGQWRRYVNKHYSDGQQVTYDHILYGPCFVLATDTVHAVIETFDRQEWRVDDEGVQTLHPVAGGDRLEVMFSNLTQRPFQQPPVVRHRKCKNCGEKFANYLDNCPACETSWAASRTKAAQPATNIDWSNVDLSLLD